MELIEQKLKTLTSYHGVIVNVRLDEARLPAGSTAKREVVGASGRRDGPAAGARRHGLRVRQYRYPFSRTLLEVPAGKLELGEAPEPSCGARARRRRVPTVMADAVPGRRTLHRPVTPEEVLHIYLARDLHAARAHLDPGGCL
ncbi:MAG: hypothetical protein ACLSHG_13390 [Oscillospiraceae bacterium]